MKFAFLYCCLAGLALCGCSGPDAGPTTEDVLSQATGKGEIVFDVVKVDDRVVATLLAQPKPRFATLFDKVAAPPRLPIAIGDTISVVIWEAAAGGLFTEAAPPLLPAVPEQRIEPLTPPARPRNEPGGGRNPSAEELFGNPQPPAEAPPPTEPSPGLPGGLAAGAAGTELSQALQGVAAENAREGIRLPEQQVGTDGGISVPFAGRIVVAGRSPEEVGAIIEQRLAGKGLEPRVLVLVSKSAVNSVSVTGEVVHGARIPLSPGGNRLLQVIAAAGGARDKVHDILVRLSRNGVTASIPLATLVADPAEDIWAQPGDVLTLAHVPKTFSVFGATAVNRAVTFDAPQVSVTEALARVHGLRDDRTDPSGVFLFRYEPVALVKELGQPVATRPVGGGSPIVYRFDMWNPKSYLLASRFLVRDKDIIFVADAKGRRIYKFAQALADVLGPVESGALVCLTNKC